MGRPFDNPIKEVVRVIDGDTVEVVVDLGWQSLEVVTLRLQGVDTPELNKAAQKEAAKIAADATTGWLACYEGRLRIHSASLDKYGRSVGDLYIEDDPNRPVVPNTLALYLLHEGYGMKTEGKSRHEWSKEQLSMIVNKREKP